MPWRTAAMDEHHLLKQPNYSNKNKCSCMLPGRCLTLPVYLGKPVWRRCKRLLLLAGIFTMTIRAGIGQPMMLNAEQSDKVSGQLPFKTADNRIIIEARRGQDTFLMVLDSYATFTAMPEDWVRKWRLPKTPYRFATRDFQNKRHKTNLRSMDSLRIGDTLYASRFYVNPKKNFNQYQLGYLGTDFLDGLNWKINFSDSTIFYQSTPFKAAQATIYNEFKPNEFPWFEVSLDGITQRTVVDLGAATALAFPANSAIGQHILAQYNPPAQRIRSGGANSAGIMDTQYFVTVESI
ncbi:MAG: retropepsin-like domain-containing protein, partial [Chitinophagaceae bacterium]|nr:retropepsin-like domain-containing protein [Chitinophagaceae bacterium]